LRVNDALFGAALWLLAAGILWQAASFPAMPGQSFGPSLVPGVLAGGFLLCGLGLVVSGARARGAGPLVARPAALPSGEGRDRLLDAAIVLGGLVVLVLLWDRLGFLIGGTLYTTLLVYRFHGGGVARAVLVAAVACFLVDWGFRRLLLVPLPMGPLTGVVW
jgi:putative tricarboxylic transport membrane protein